jgi:hypothetical protein
LGLNSNGIQNVSILPASVAAIDITSLSPLNQGSSGDKTPPVTMTS